MLQEFRTELAPYGRWENDPDLGSIWYPNDAHFEPYVDGEWVYTTQGWAFVSTLPYSWAVFHYGRWALTPVGWGWVPGYVWAPAWVSFRAGERYIGWSPLGPNDFVYGFTPVAGYYPWFFVEIGLFGHGVITPTVVLGASYAWGIYPWAVPVAPYYYYGVPTFHDVPHVVPPSEPLTVIRTNDPAKVGVGAGRASFFRIDPPGTTAGTSPPAVIETPSQAPRAWPTPRVPTSPPAGGVQAQPQSQPPPSVVAPAPAPRGAWPAPPSGFGTPTPPSSSAGRATTTPSAPPAPAPRVIPGPPPASSGWPTATPPPSASPPPASAPPRAVVPAPAPSPPPAAPPPPAAAPAPAPAPAPSPPPAAPVSPGPPAGSAGRAAPSGGPKW